MLGSGQRHDQSEDEASTFLSDTLSEFFRGFQEGGSCARGVAVVPDLHVDVDALIKRVVVVEPVVGRLHRLHRALNQAALHVLNLSWNGALFEAATRVVALVTILHAF